MLKENKLSKRDSNEEKLNIKYTISATNFSWSSKDQRSQIFTTKHASKKEKTSFNCKNNHPLSEALYCPFTQGCNVHNL